MPVLGPSDRRTLRKRCLACTRRKIKCEGGSPCLYCLKKKQKCVPQAAAAVSEAVFVNTSSLPPGGIDVSLRGKGIQKRTPKLCSNVPQDKSCSFMRYFFSGFLVRNDFGGPLDLDSITAHSRSSSSLYHASIAVGALDLSRKTYLCSAAELKDARMGALTAYRSSISSFQKDLETEGFLQGEASLWTTFFLGLFELMYDDTGQGFVKHFLYGTSRILQIRCPEAHLNGPGRSFFLTVRVFEVCRSLIYSEPTFLCQPSWRNLTNKIRDESGIWHPKEDLLDLMIDCSELSHRVWTILQPDPILLTNIFEDRLNRLATDGLHIQAALSEWNASFQQLYNGTFDTTPDSHTLLATIYFNAISIFLSGIFDYRPQFSHITAPSLAQTRIQHHVSAILSNAEAALQTTNLGGILLFFPLRVAGARVTTSIEAANIAVMLREISKRSFVVADAFVADLKELWLCKGL